MLHMLILTLIVVGVSSQDGRPITTCCDGYQDPHAARNGTCRQVTYHVQQMYQGCPSNDVGASSKDGRPITTCCAGYQAPGDSPNGTCRQVTYQVQQMYQACPPNGTVIQVNNPDGSHSVTSRISELESKLTLLENLYKDVISRLQKNDEALEQKIKSLETLVVQSIKQQEGNERIKPPKECKTSRMGLKYAGRVRHTRSGLLCQRWDAQQPHRHTRTNVNDYPDLTLSQANNFCRNPDKEPNGPWCYTTDPRVRWQHCNVPPCECKVTRKGPEYQGQVQTTRSGRKCQRWDAQTPHTHGNNDPRNFPEDNLAEAQNFCRNPDGGSEGPWCYTMDANVRWEYCLVPLCSE